MLDEGGVLAAHAQQLLALTSDLQKMRWNGRIDKERRKVKIRLKRLNDPALI
jgi:hypothetical protein